MQHQCESSLPVLLDGATGCACMKQPSGLVASPNIYFERNSPCLDKNVYIYNYLYIYILIYLFIYTQYKLFSS